MVTAIFEMFAKTADLIHLLAHLGTPPPVRDLMLLTNGDRSPREFERLDAAFVQLHVGEISLRFD